MSGNFVPSSKQAAAVLEMVKSLEENLKKVKRELRKHKTTFAFQPTPNRQKLKHFRHEYTTNRVDGKVYYDTTTERYAVEHNIQSRCDSVVAALQQTPVMGVSDILRALETTNNGKYKYTDITHALNRLQQFGVVERCQQNPPLFRLTRGYQARYRNVRNQLRPVRVRAVAA